MNTNVCSQTDDLFNQNNQYLKSVCEISEDSTYSQAKKICEDNGMFLFIVTNSDVQSAFFKLASDRNGYTAYAQLWINGRKKEDNIWIAESSNYPLNITDWYNGESNIGECLSILKRHGGEQMKASGEDCSKIAWVYCEFINSGI